MLDTDPWHHHRTLRRATIIGVSNFSDYCTHSAKADRFESSCAPSPLFRLDDLRPNDDDTDLPG